MRVAFANYTFRQAVVVTGDDGALAVRWADLVELIGPRAAPPYACTLVAFDGTAERDAALAAALDLRDNSASHLASSPPHGGPHVLLTVHFDRPVDPGTPYGDAVSCVYAGRGNLSASIEGGKEAWTVITDSDRCRTGEVTRETPAGTEVAWQVGRLGGYLDPDLSTLLSESLARHGLRLLGDFHVGRVFPGERQEPVWASRPVRRAFEGEVEGLMFAAASRGEARALMTDPAVPRMLRRLDEGCVVMWADNPGEWNRLSSYQLRPGGGPPLKVSGLHVETLVRLGAAEVFWTPTPEEGFHSSPWLLVRINDRGRMLLAGDVAGAVAKAIGRGRMSEVTRRRTPQPFAATVTEYASGLPQKARDAIRGDMVYPKTVDLAAMARRIGNLEPLAIALNGLVSGRAVLGADGRLKEVAAKPRAKAGSRAAGAPRAGAA